MTVYLVTGPHPYRDHRPGETFEATLEPDVEARAVASHAIRIVDARPVTYDSTAARMPSGWGKRPSRKGSQLGGEHHG